MTEETKDPYEWLESQKRVASKESVYDANGVHSWAKSDLVKLDYAKEALDMQKAQYEERITVLEEIALGSVTNLCNAAQTETGCVESICGCEKDGARFDVCWRERLENIGLVMEL